MPYDPSLPAANSPNSSAQMRGQLNGLKDLIDAISSITSAQVDATTTLPAGSPAQASVSLIGNTLHFTFQIPEGTMGPQGPQGSQGEVSQAALDAAIAGTSSNSNAVSPLGTIYPDPEMEEMRAKINELIQALRR